ncbi:hypothetical protein ACFQ0Q_38245 [Streptomyces aureus]
MLHEEAAAGFGTLEPDVPVRPKGAAAAAVARTARAVVPLEVPVMRPLLAEGCWSMLPQERPS